MNVRAQLDLVPAADLEATLNALADVLETLNPGKPRNELRAWALELLAHPVRAAAILTGDLTSLLPSPDLLTEPGDADEHDRDSGGAGAEDARAAGGAGPDDDQATTGDAGPDSPNSPSGSGSGGLSRTGAPVDEGASAGVFGTAGSSGASGATDAFFTSSHQTPDTPSTRGTGPGVGRLGVGIGAARTCGSCASGTRPSGREISLIVHVHPADLEAV